MTPLSMGILQTRILEWVAMPFSRRSSRSRDQTQVSCIAGELNSVNVDCMFATSVTINNTCCNWSTPSAPYSFLFLSQWDPPTLAPGLAGGTLVNKTK